MPLKLNILSVHLLVLASTALIAATSFAQEAKTKNEEVEFFKIEFDAETAYPFAYGFAGYGLDGEAGKDVGNSVSVKHLMAKTGGNPDHCATATLDSTKLAIPDNTSYEYAGWGLGTAIDLAKPFNATDLSGYSISFDAKVAGTKTLGSSKVMVRFLAADDAVAKDDDQNDDVVAGLVRGQDDGTDTFSLTNEFKTYTFKLSDLDVKSGSLEALAKTPSTRISIAVQAQGEAYDIGKDADNVLYVDNLRMFKTGK